MVIPAVPDKFDVVNPEIEPPNVIVPVLVIVPPVKVIPDTVPAVATEVTPIPPTTLEAVVAKDAVVANDELNALVSKDAVPNNDPVNELAQTFPLTVKEADVGVIVPIPSLLPEPCNVGPSLPNFMAPLVTSCTPYIPIVFTTLIS